MDSNAHKKYHYILDDGKVTGPISRLEIEDLLLKKIIKNNTLIWDGEGDWTPVQNTELAQYIISPPPPPPPPPPPSNLDSERRNTDEHSNKWAWGIAVSAFFIGALGVIAWGIAIIFSFIDYKKCKEKNIEISPKWMVFIPILYLWKRYKKFADNKKIFWVGIIGIVLSLVYLLSDGSFGNSHVEEEACIQVTQMMNFGSYITGVDELGMDLECEKVKITREISDGKYAAIAILNSGDIADITIRTDGDRVKASINR